MKLIENYDLSNPTIISCYMGCYIQVSSRKLCVCVCVWGIARTVCICLMRFSDMHVTKCVFHVEIIFMSRTWTLPLQSVLILQSITDVHLFWSFQTKIPLVSTFLYGVWSYVPSHKDFRKNVLVWVNSMCLFMICIWLYWCIAFWTSALNDQISFPLVPNVMFYRGLFKKTNDY